MKICGRCGEEKPLDGFYVDRRATDGLTYDCKPCRKAANKRTQDRTPVAVKRERYRRDNATAAGRAKFKRYYVRNREKYQEWNRIWREANPDRQRELWERWYAENRERLSEARRATYDPAKKRATRNPEQGRKDSYKRRARLAAVEYEYIDRKALYERDHGTCCLCHETVPDSGWEMDHIVPISKGGPHVWSNVQVTCPPCNRKKWARLEGQIALPVGSPSHRS